MKKTGAYLVLFSIVSFLILSEFHGQGVPPEIAPSTISKWEQQGKGRWKVLVNKQEKSLQGIASEYLLQWFPDERGSKGKLRSQVFTIEKEFQVFGIAGK